MDFTLSVSSDWFNLLSLPLIFLTVKDVAPKWKSIWDADLTMEDRRLLMRIVIFLVLPLVVFVHELGHLLAALSVQAKVYDFHYGPVVGHVTVSSNLAPEKLLWIAIAGNLAQVAIGLLALFASLVIRSAPAVAFLVYLGLFAIGDTVIFYAALSLASIYGDWIQIYQSPCTQLVLSTAGVHAVLVALVVYCLCGKLPRLWFARKTMPGWLKTNQDLEAAARANPSAESLLALVHSYMEAGLQAEARRCLKQAEALDAEHWGVACAKADLELTCGNLDRAREMFEKLARDDTIPNKTRANLILQVGELWLCRNDPDRALRCFEAASILDERLADARLQKAILKANKKDYDDLEKDLLALKAGDNQWLYRRNKDIAPREIEKLEALLKRVNKKDQ
jgi:tetratricopeptide (TPR) repeat protein